MGIVLFNDMYFGMGEGEYLVHPEFFPPGGRFGPSSTCCVDVALGGTNEAEGDGL